MPGQRILVTGASGLVGSAFVRRAAGDGCVVTGIVGRFSGFVPGLTLTRQMALDLTNLEDVRAVARRMTPEVIVNCAAEADASRVNADPSRSRALNVDLPLCLAELARELGCRLLHLSSEQVFDGRCREAYSETSEPCPINLYGLQKLESERLVRSTAGKLAIIVRLPLLVGNSLTGSRSLHEQLLLQWAAGSTPRLFIDEYRQVCAATDVAEIALQLCRRSDLSGITHWAGAELVSRYELGRRIRQRFALGEADAPLVQVKRDEVPSASLQRPQFLSLDVSTLQRTLRRRPGALTTQLSGLRIPPACEAWFAGRPARRFSRQHPGASTGSGPQATRLGP